MRNIAYSAILAAGLFALGCGIVGSAGPGNLEVKHPGSEAQTVNLQSGKFSTTTKTWTWPGETKGKFDSATTANASICTGNFEVKDAGYPSAFRTKEKKDGMIQLCFSLNGPKGEKEDGVATGTYQLSPPMRSGPAEMTIDYAYLLISEDGETKEFSPNRNAKESTIKINSASADSVSGEVELDDGELSIKGSFSATAEE